MSERLIQFLSVNLPFYFAFWLICVLFTTVLQILGDFRTRNRHFICVKCGKITRFEYPFCQLCALKRRMIKCGAFTGMCTQNLIFRHFGISFWVFPWIILDIILWVLLCAIFYKFCNFKYKPHPVSPSPEEAAPSSPSPAPSLPTPEPPAPKPELSTPEPSIPEPSIPEPPTLEPPAPEPSTPEPSFCRHCGQPIDADSLFCRFCGERQREYVRRRRASRYPEA